MKDELSVRAAMAIRDTVRRHVLEQDAALAEAKRALPAVLAKKIRARLLERIGPELQAIKRMIEREL